jgi:hypothetical protein
MRLSAIQKQLQELSALPYPTETKLGGTTYRLCGDKPFRKFAPVKPERAIEIHDPTKQAIKLYGTEKNATEVIRRHLDTLGDDLDPVVRKRAERFCVNLERGHTVVTQHETERKIVYERGKLRTVYQRTGVILGYRASMPFAEIAAAELGKITNGWGHGQWITLTLDDIEQLQEKFNINIQ